MKRSEDILILALWTLILFWVGGSEGNLSTPFAQWVPDDLLAGLNEYRLSNYFYLPEKTPIWTNQALLDFGTRGRGDIFLIAPTGKLNILPSGARWKVIKSDAYHTLLLGSRSG